MHLNVYWIVALALLAMAVVGLVALIRRQWAQRQVDGWQDEFGVSTEDQDGENLTESATDPIRPIWGRMEVLVEDRRISTHRIHLEKTTIGRDPGRAKIVIPELIVSKRHCSLFEREGQLWIRDENSTNGVYREGETVAESRVDHGAVFSLGRKGNVKLIFTTDPPAAE